MKKMTLPLIGGLGFYKERWEMAWIPELQGKYSKNSMGNTCSPKRMPMPSGQRLIIWHG